MKKLSTALALLVCTLASPLAMASTWPAASRAVYYGGKRHYISLDDNQRIVHYEADASDFSWLGKPTENGVVDIPKGYKRQVPAADKGQGVALYGSTMLHYSVVLDSGDPWLMMVRYDLNLGKFSEAPVLYAKLDVLNDDYGVAAAVVSGNVYVFTNSLTLTSARGGLGESRRREDESREGHSSRDPDRSPHVGPPWGRDVQSIGRARTSRCRIRRRERVRGRTGETVPPRGSPGLQRPRHDRRRAEGHSPRSPRAPRGS